MLLLFIYTLFIFGENNMIQGATPRIAPMCMPRQPIENTIRGWPSVIKLSEIWSMLVKLIEAWFQSLFDENSSSSCDFLVKNTELYESANYCLHQPSCMCGDHAHLLVRCLTILIQSDCQLCQWVSIFHTMWMKVLFWDQEIGRGTRAGNCLYEKCVIHITDYCDKV